mmetsp:Transcript_7465/g.13270  ORF Transcript_7465/g.13270 Transcript_7465/m.13270 type:complete len:215 (-) Transcript_7465:1437-2081(-)
MRSLTSRKATSSLPPTHRTPAVPTAPTPRLGSPSRMPMARTAPTHSVTLTSMTSHTPTKSPPCSRLDPTRSSSTLVTSTVRLSGMPASSARVATPPSRATTRTSRLAALLSTSSVSSPVTSPGGLATPSPGDRFFSLSVAPTSSGPDPSLMATSLVKSLPSLVPSFSSWEATSVSLKLLTPAVSSSLDTVSSSLARARQQQNPTPAAARVLSNL